ncbi:MAG: DUF255 domain-containing protein [Lentisphaerae bacterium]|nr:DUF255 domain-containing protein [Lentisphaerota bacterium]
MKKFIVSVLAVVCCSFAVAAKDVPAGWTIDYDAALKEARQSGKNVLILFTASDWCSWCKRLRKDVLTKNSFEKYAKDHLVLVYFDFPHRNKLTQRQMGIQQGLAAKFKVDGFPTTVVVDPEGKKLLTIPGYRQLDAYLKLLESVK